MSEWAYYKLKQDIIDNFNLLIIKNIDFLNKEHKPKIHAGNQDKF